MVVSSSGNWTIQLFRMVIGLRIIEKDIYEGEENACCIKLQRY
jgi:hypothetical protein